MEPRNGPEYRPGTGPHAPGRQERPRSHHEGRGDRVVRSEIIRGGQSVAHQVAVHAPVAQALFIGELAAIAFGLD
jgi:hypothetical protein